MNLITANVLRHLVWQLVTCFVVGGIGALGHFDFSQLGPYAMTAQLAIALIASVVNEALGTAPSK